MTTISFVNQALSFGVIISQIFMLLAVFYLALRQVGLLASHKEGGFVVPIIKRFFEFIGKNGILLAFIVSVFAMLGSLFYSEIAGYEPCKLCWFQRIFMYPQTILLGIALWRKDFQIALCGLVLSAIGAIIAGYHYVMQIGVVPSLPCSVVGYSVSCSQRFVLQFGYITIPMMALTAFLLIIIFLVFHKLTRLNNSTK